MTSTPAEIDRDAQASNGTGESTATRLSASDLEKVTQLVKGSGSVELKLTVPATGHRATIKSLGLDPVEAQPRQAFFFDRPDLALNKAGLIVRARRIQGGTADTVIKLRPVDPATIDPELRRSDSFKIEVDAMPGGFVCSASMKGVCTGQEVLDVTTGSASIRSLFSREQREYFEAHAPEGITLNSLVTLGPIFVLKAKHRPKDFDERIVVEMWLYPDGSRILEISTKALPSQAFQVAAEFRAWLSRNGIDVTAEQSTKTKSALEILTREKQAAS